MDSILPVRWRWNPGRESFRFFDKQKGRFHRTDGEIDLLLIHPGNLPGSCLLTWRLSSIGQIFRCRPALFHFGALWRVQVLLTGSGLRDIQFIRPDPPARVSGANLSGIARNLQRAVLLQRYQILLIAFRAPKGAPGS